MPIDLTAMVDVVFLLIIFFLTTTSLIEKTRVQLDLPQEQGREEGATSLPSLVVNVTIQGEYIVEGQRVSEAQLFGIVDRILTEVDTPAQLDLLIRADRGAALIHVNRLATGLRTRGIETWRFATEVNQRGGGA